jgi:hypothetical protein
MNGSRPGRPTRERLLIFNLQSSIEPSMIESMFELKIEDVSM